MILGLLVSLFYFIILLSHCTSKNQINQEQLQEKCRREVGVMLISVRTQLPDDMTPARSNNVTKIVDDRAVGVMEFSPYNAP